MTSKTSMKNNFRFYPEVVSNRFIFMTFVMMESILPDEEKKNENIKNEEKQVTSFDEVCFLKI